MIKAKLTPNVQGEGRGAYRPHKPSREAMICLDCTLPSKNCNKGNCKRYIEEMEKIKHEEKGGSNEVQDRDH